MDKRELYNDISLYIQNIYARLNNILDVVYSQMNLDVIFMQTVYNDLNTLVEYMNIVGENENINFETENLVNAIKNYLKANKTSNYLLLADTIEYEIIPIISVYYDVILGDILEKME